MPSKYRKPKFTDDQFKNARNPLLRDDFKVPVHRRRPKGYLQRDTKTDTWIPHEYDLDADKSVKVYIKAENRRSVSLLKDRAQRLFLWLIYEIEPSKDYLWINKGRYMEENCIRSVNTFKDALADLIRYEYIVESFIPGVYWINPRLMFNGSRVNKYPEHIGVISEEEVLMFVPESIPKGSRKNVDIKQSTPAVVVPFQSHG